MDKIELYSARDRYHIAEAIMNGRVEHTDSGLVIPGMKLAIQGVYDVQVTCGGEKVSHSVTKNLITNEGLNYLLDVLLYSGTAKPANWYAGVFEGNYTPVATVTGATIAAAATECTAYDEAARPAYTVVAASSQTSTNNASKAVFTFNASKTIYGGFIITTATKSDTAGKLLSAVRFSSSHAVQDNYELNLRYDLTAASA